MCAPSCTSTPNEHRERAVMAVAQTQRGLFTTTQAGELGWNEHRLHRRQRSGRISRVQPGVYAVAGSPQTWEQRVLAAVLAAGEGAVASHETAASLHGFPASNARERTTISVSVPTHREPTVNGATLHRVILPSNHRTIVDGIATTTYERTLVDHAANLSLGQLARALDHGLVTNRVRLRSMRETLGALHAGPGRRTQALYRLLDERAPETERSESTPEIRVLTALRAAGVPLPTPQYWVSIAHERFRLDAAYPEARVGLEYQGWDPHRSRTAFDADYRRDRLLTVAGWTILYFTSASTNADIVSDVTGLLENSPNASENQRTGGTPPS